MKAIKIDAENRTISLIDIEPGLAALQEQVGGFIETALYFDDNVMYVDEEGLYKGHRVFQWWPRQKRLFVGNGIIVGTTKNGDDKDTTMTIEQAEQVEFVDAIQAMELAHEYGL